MNLASTSIAAACLGCAIAAATVFAQQTTPPKTTPPGEEKTTGTRALEAGAGMLQEAAPLKGHDIYLNGFHPMKEHPDIQVEAHHYCRQVNEDFAQCVLYDGNTATANLNGIEYIISEKLFNTLPEGERELWHPHNGEILSGQLVAPRIPDTVEKQLMKGKLNSYGKTWHVWNTGNAAKPGDKVPFGEPMLAWSFNRDGEAQPGLVEARDKALGINTQDKRRQRADLVDLAKPQEGVDELKGKFGRPTRDIPGVVDIEAVSKKQTK